MRARCAEMPARPLPPRPPAAELGEALSDVGYTAGLAADSFARLRPRLERPPRAGCSRGRGAVTAGMSRDVLVVVEGDGP